MENKNTKYAEDTIDLLELFFVLKQKALLIIAVALVFAGAAAGFTKFFITPTYSSTAMILVVSKQNTLTSIADLQFGSQLAEDYTVLINNRPVMEQVIENIGLDMTYSQLKNSVSVQNPADTHILTISATVTDPNLAKAIVDELAKVSSDYIGERMEVTPPKIIEEGQVPTTHVGPNMKKNILIGFLAGAVLVCGILVVMELMNDSIQTEEDIEKYLEVPALAIIPDRALIKESSRGTKKSKKTKGRKEGK